MRNYGRTTPVNILGLFGEPKRTDAWKGDTGEKWVKHRFIELVRLENGGRMCEMSIWFIKPLIPLQFLSAHARGWMHVLIIKVYMFQGGLTNESAKIKSRYVGSTFVALGGGVIGDMTGFAAACFQRGVHFVQIPTTVMAQVDSSVGGKTGVNHPLGKNMIGAFFQPLVVLIDTTTLSTLPDRELASGISEIIKYGLIRDADLFCWLEDNLDKLLMRDPAALTYAIERSCINKVRRVFTY